MTAGVGLSSLLTPSSCKLRRAILQTVAGIGLGILFLALNIPMQKSLDDDNNELAIGTFIFARQLDAVFGSVLAFTIFTNLFTRDLPQSLPDTLSVHLSLHNNLALCLARSRDSQYSPTCLPEIYPSLYQTRYQNYKKVKILKLC